MVRAEPTTLAQQAQTLTTQPCSRYY